MLGAIAAAVVVLVAPSSLRTSGVVDKGIQSLGATFATELREAGSGNALDVVSWPKVSDRPSSL